MRLFQHRGIAKDTGHRGLEVVGHSVSKGIQFFIVRLQLFGTLLQLFGALLELNGALP